MDKISAVKVGTVTKLAASALRALSGRNQELEAENGELKAKVAHYEHEKHAEKIATMMEEKGIETNSTFQEKVANLLQRDDLRVVEEAVQMSSPQMKLASISSGNVVVEGGIEGGAESAFMAGLSD